MKAHDILELMRRIGALKSIPRTGWRLRGVREGESVADHAFRVVALAMVLADGARERGVEVDALKVLRMAVLHDLGEAEIGDIPLTALAYLTRETKDRAEGEAVKSLLEPLGRCAGVYMELWNELAAGLSMEARLVRTADRLETLIQAREYERNGSRRLDDFWENLSDRAPFAEFPEAEGILRILLAERAC